jgi:transcription factor AP-4
MTLCIAENDKDYLRLKLSEGAYGPEMGGITRNLTSQKPRLDRDQTMRREIANSNERRRMQSINTGFQQLKSLLPLCDDDKISKSAILQQAVDYINNLQRDRTRLKLQNERFAQLLGDMKYSSDIEDTRPLKRKNCPVSFIDPAGCLSSLITGDDVIHKDGLTLKDSLAHDAQRLRLESSAKITELKCRVAEMQTVLDNEVQKGNLMKDLITRILPESSVVNELIAFGGEELGNALLKIESMNADGDVNVKQEIELYPNALRVMTTKADDRSLIMNSMSRRNLDTIVEAIRHLEGEPSTLVKRIRLTSSSIGDDSSVTIFCSGDPEQFAIDGQTSLRSDDVISMPAVAAFELVSDEQYIMDETASGIMLSDSVNQAEESVYIPLI